MSAPLRRTWLQLTAWYVGVFGLVLVAFGAGLYVVVTREISRSIDRGLEMAVSEAGFALGIRERERNVHQDEHVDALDELNVPGHDMYVFDGQLMLIRPQEAPDWVEVAAREALAGQSVMRSRQLPDRMLRLHARAFEIRERQYAAVAVAEAFAIDRQYPYLVRGFLLAGFASVILVALGGSLLVRHSCRTSNPNPAAVSGSASDSVTAVGTPAAVLRSTAEVGLQRTRTPEEHARILTTMRDESARLGHLVEGLLLLASADDHRLRIRSEHVFLDDLLADAANAARALASNKEVTIRVGAFEEAPVIGDPVLLRQLLLIFLDNAIKFSPAGGEVEGSVTARDRRACACIRDRGPGIPSSEVPHIFERFYRAEPDRDRSGAGIGLSIAAVIADAHDATIRIDSKVGEGTTICVELPLATAVATEPRPPVPATP